MIGIEQQTKKKMKKQFCKKNIFIYSYTIHIYKYLYKLIGIEQQREKTMNENDFSKRFSTEFAVFRVPAAAAARQNQQGQQMLCL